MEEKKGIIIKHGEEAKVTDPVTVSDAPPTPQPRKCIPDCGRTSCSNRYKGGCPGGRDWIPITEKQKIETLRYGWWDRRKKPEDEDAEEGLAC